jgi:CheY-like chemotaxis protein
MEYREKYEEKPHEQKKDESLENISRLEGKKILVAEDNKINFFVVNKFLTGWGIKVTHAENGRLALDKLKEDKFDLILMDLQMPVMDGFEASRIIRNSEDKRLSAIPIIALTAAMMSENEEKVADIKINDYIMKPFRPQDLSERITKHIK